MKCELTNMVMIENLKDNTVLVENRVKYWKGITFPGGHIEKDESFTDSAIREAREETGLEIINPKLCGIVHWCNKDTNERYIVVLFKTTEFSGEIIDGTDEGKVFWIPKDTIYNYNLSPNFSEYLHVFLEDKNEAFGLHDNNGDEQMTIL